MGTVGSATNPGRNKGIDWKDKEMLELLDVLIGNPQNIRKYINYDSNETLAQAINDDYPELEISTMDIPRVIAMVKVRYANGWLM